MKARLPQGPTLFRAFNLIAAIGVIAAAYFYFIGAANYIDWLSRGVIGATCSDCPGNAEAGTLNVIPRGPADRSGIRTGDRILSVDGLSYRVYVRGLIEDDFDALAGEPGSRVRLTTMDANGVRIEHTLIRERGWEDISTIGFRLLGLGEAAAIDAALAIEALIVLGFTATGIFIWRRHRSWITFLAGFSLVLLVFPTTRSPLFLPLGAARTIFFSTAIISFYILFFTFPDGKMQPARGWWAILLYLAWLVINALLVRPLLGSFDYSRLLDIFFWAFALRAQFTRYRVHSGPEQRQQIKWVLAGFFFAVIERSVFLMLLFLVPDLMFPVTSTELSNLYVSFGDLATRLLFLVIPLTFLLSMLRYRLWEIDYVINRSLVYGSLAILLGLIFAGTLYVAQSFLATFLSENQVLAASILLASAAAIGLFPRLLNRLRKFVDARLYGINLDYKGIERAAAQDLFRRAEKKGIEGVVDMQLIGRGGMGEVYCGRQAETGLKVAVKILPAATTHDPHAIRRFMREARIASRLDHPNIVRTFDFGELDGNPYIIMEFIEGIDLETLLTRDRSIPEADFCKIWSEIGNGLTYSHSLGIVHRDIKPSNIMIETADPERPFSGPYRCVLTDFGIAKVLDETHQYSSVGFKGTFEYIAPEQITEAPDLDNRVDVYSSGVVAYRMLTGRLPFPNTNLARLLLAHLHRPPDPPRSINAAIPIEREAAVLKALEKDPVVRFGSIGDFVGALCPQ